MFWFGKNFHAGSDQAYRSARSLMLALALFALVIQGLVVSPEIAAAEAAAAQDKDSTINHEDEYAACMELVRRSPAAAVESAEAWHSLGGGAAAQHCAAVALHSLKRYADAATMFARSSAAIAATKPALAAELLAQGAQARMLDGDVAAAETLIRQAIKIRPDDTELRIDLAATLGQQGEFGAALEQLDVALRHDPQHVVGLTYRASALRRLEQPAAALQAVDLALSLDPDHADAHLERGFILFAQDDIMGAGAAWSKAARLAQGTRAGDIALRNLEVIREEVQ